MDAKQKAIDVLKASLNELTAKTEALKKTRDEAHKAALNIYEAAKAEADRIFDERMKECACDEKDAESIRKALVELGEKEFAKKSKAKTKVAKPKGERVPFPKTLDEAKTDKEKIGVILTKLGKGTVDEIEAALTKAGVEITKKSIQQSTFQMKKDGQLDKAGKQGKAFEYKIV